MGVSEYISKKEQPPARRSIFNRLKNLGIIGMVMVCSLLSTWGWATRAPVPVILDTDISSDVDDVGAVAVLHSLANEGKADILAMMVSAVNPSAVGCLQALNNYFGRAGIPVGTVSGNGVLDESKYTAIIAKEFPAKKDGTSAAARDAAVLYREVLAGQPDHSVLIVTIGYLTNLKNLLNSAPDKVSPLTGRELVDRKVKKLVTMGGQYPKGREWNFYKDRTATTRIVADWPTPILFCGFESGVKVLTGSGLRETPEANPLRRSYELYNGLTDRSSWDQLTVLYAVEGVEANSQQTTRMFNSVGGINTILSDGSNVWQSNASGKHSYVVNSFSSVEMKEKIEQHMIDAITKAAR
jgi:inosine-uridine nucleoside N-ribohydrolase